MKKQKILAVCNNNRVLLIAHIEALTHYFPANNSVMQQKKKIFINNNPPH